MKKIIIAIFLAILMLMIPISSAIKTDEVVNNVGVSSTNTDVPLFYISEENYLDINGYIELTFQDDEAKKAEAYEIRDSIITEASEESKYAIDPINLAQSLIEYTGIEPIPEEQLTISNVNSIQELNDLIETYWKVKDGKLIEGIFSELVDKIIQTIKDRLGWIYELAERAYTLFIDSITLVYDFIQPAILAIAVVVAQVFNTILSVPQLFRELITYLFHLEFNPFVETIKDFSDNLVNNVSVLIQTAIDIVNNQQLKTYLTSVQDFINWVSGKPWEDPILVEGSVRYNIGYLEGATVTCRGESITTDVNGRFSFYVYPSNTDPTSFPANQSYGMHDCTITVIKDGEVIKQSMPRLSYAFSGGKIQWPFFIIKSKSKYTNFMDNIMERFSNMLERFQALFPNLFRFMNHLNMPTT